MQMNAVSFNKTNKKKQ